MHSFYIKINIELSSKEKDGSGDTPSEKFEDFSSKAPSNFLDCK